MEKTMTENNVVEIAGEITSEKMFSHEVYGEGFYVIMVSVSRLSGTVDVIPVMVSERYPLFAQLNQGEFVSVIGQYRSFNRYNETPKIVLTVFTRDIFMVKEPGTTNSITLVGNICKKPVLRQTKMGKSVCDILIAVNRQYGKSDYIPCISWGRNAAFSASLKVGDRVVITGRIQSREYKKVVNNTEKFLTAYEVSASRISAGN